MKPRIGAVTALLLVWLVLAGSSQALAQAVDAWASRAPMPVALALPTNVGVVDGLLYAVGGANPGGLVATVNAYNPRTNVWTSKASLPTLNAAPGVGAVDGILYAVGGYTAPDSTFSSIARVFAYDPAANVWTEVAPMSAARWTPGVAVVNGILYAIGGAAGGGTPLQTVEAYDPGTNTWTPKASMPTPRFLFGLGQVDGIIYVAGGQNNSGNLATVEAYDPQTNTWTPVASMPGSRTRLAAGVLNGRLYAVGGDSLGTVEAYDPATNTWETKLSMPTPRDTLGAGVVNGVLHAVGGTSAGNVFHATNEAYCPRTPPATAPAASGRCR